VLGYSVGEVSTGRKRPLTDEEGIWTKGTGYKRRTVKATRKRASQTLTKFRHLKPR